MSRCPATQLRVTRLPTVLGRQHHLRPGRRYWFDSKPNHLWVGEESSSWSEQYRTVRLQQHSWSACLELALASATVPAPYLRAPAFRACTQSQLLCVKKTNRDRETVWWPLQSPLLVELFETGIEESWQTQRVSECGEHTLKHHKGLEIRGSVSSYQLH